MTTVALVCGAFRPSRDGVADYTARLALRLAQEGVEPVVLASGEAEELPALNVRQVADIWDLRGVRQAATTIRCLDPDLVHVQFAPAAYGFRGSIGLLPHLLGGLRLVVTLHEYGWWTWEPRWVPAPVRRMLWPAGERMGCWDRETGCLAPCADVILTVDSGYAEIARARLKCAEIQVVPIAPNVPVVPVDRGEARVELRRQLDAPADAPVAVFFGFVHPVKGIPYLLDAVVTLRCRHPDLRLAVIGGFASLALPEDEARSYRAELQAEMALRGLRDIVYLTGWQPEEAVSRLLAGADFGVLPFTAGVTAKSGALLTLLAHGLPTVATEAQDQQLKTGGVVLVPPRDSGAIAKAITRLLECQDLRERLAREASEAVGADPWGEIVEAHLQVYTQVGGR